MYAHNETSVLRKINETITCNSGRNYGIGACQGILALSTRIFLDNLIPMIRLSALHKRSYFLEQYIIQTTS